MRFAVKKKARINPDSGSALLEESFAPLVNGAEENSVRPSRIEKPILRTRFYFIVAFIALSAFVLLARTLYIAVLNQKSYQKLYSASHSKTQWILAPRGLIKDTNGHVLAYNAPGKNENEFSRQYPDGPFLSDILGYIGRVDSQTLDADASYLPFDLVGKDGVERQYESSLRGTYGRIDKPVTAEGSMRKTALKADPKPGNTVVLNIDATIQKALTQFLEEKVKETKSPGGAAIMLDPRNGNVISLVTTPRYDNNNMTPSVFEDSGRPLFNRAIAGEYPPGSSIKPFMASAVLKEHVISPDTIINDRGKITIPSFFDPAVSWTFHSWKALGLVNMRRALALSSNIYFYTVGGGHDAIKGLGIGRIIDYFGRFGFGKASAIDLPGATNGFIPSPAWKKDTFHENWFIGDTYNTSVGQGYVRLTPIQLASATESIANGGTIFAPQVVNHIEDQKGDVIESPIHQIAYHIDMAPQDLAVVREGMRMAVTDGTVKRLSSLPHAVAAKTGSAQAGTNRSAHGWVTLFAPYENPEFVLTVLVENGGGGEQAAVPVAKKFLEWYWGEYKKTS